MKRIIFVATTIDETLGGIARSVPRLAAAIQSAYDGEVYLLAPRSERMIIPAGLAEQTILCDGHSGVKRELRSLVQESEELEFIYHAGIWTALNHFVAKFGRRNAIPVVVSVRSMLDPWALNYRKWKKWFAWHLYAKKDMKSAQVIHATADIEASYIESKLGERAQIFISPNGVDLLPGSNTNNGEKRRVLFLSRIHPKKGIVDLIEAFGRVNMPGWELVIAGNDDGNYQGVCERVAYQQENAKDIRFIGAIPDRAKWDVYASADLFILPSYSENFGIVIGEALGSRLPVITTVATPWEDLDKVGCGLCIQTGVEALCSAMSEVMLLSDEERKNMGEHGAKWIRSKFNWEVIGERFFSEMKKRGLAS